MTFSALSTEKHIALLPGLTLKKPLTKKPNNMTKHYNVYFLETESRLTDDLTTLEDAENFIATKCPGWTRSQFAIREQYCIYAHSQSIEAFRELLHMEPTTTYKVAGSISGTNAPKEWFNHEWWFDSLESAQQFMSYLAHLSVTLNCPANIEFRDMTIGIV